MSISKYPDKWIRKAFSGVLNGIVAGGKTFPCFDTNTLDYTGDTYYILSTQTAVETKNKCKSGWRSTILIEVFTRYKKNVGSRLLVDEAVEAAIEGLDGIALDPTSELVINAVSISTPNDISDKRGSEVIHRKFIRYELLIN